MNLDERLAVVIRNGARAITADTITKRGQLAVDPDRKPCSKQSSIGAAFRRWAKLGLIEGTGMYLPSQSPHRHGGVQQIHTITDKGRAWAAEQKVPYD